MKTEEKEIIWIKNDKTGKVHALVESIKTDRGLVYITLCDMNVSALYYHKTTTIKDLQNTCIRCANTLSKRKKEVIVGFKSLPIVYIMVSDDSDEAIVTKDVSSILDELREFYGDDEDVLEELESPNCDYKFYKAVEVKPIAVTEATRTILKLHMGEK